jgi:multicomponent Na+:H+ antiporter subunit D
VLLAFIFVPLLGAAIMPILRKIWAKGATWLAALVASYLVVITSWIAYREFLVGQDFKLDHWAFGGKLLLSIDGLSLVVLLAIGLVSLVTVVFSAAYPIDPDRRPGYNALILLAVTGMNGLVMSTDIFSLYVFLEIVSICSFILIAYQFDELGTEGSFKYMMLSAVATVFLLAGIALLFSVTGNVSFTGLAAGLQSGGPMLQFGFAPLR